ncbi:hypothetical protein ACHAXA_006262 [Cyclostephanos tholiformis]|uniref:RRM Nup35-type domain-containing protein n=1 Tax=Cyclostephanos tholiformis TaxID=382380 RepID=A0ABD3SNS4_9STRA
MMSDQARGSTYDLPSSLGLRQRHFVGDENSDPNDDTAGSRAPGTSRRPPSLTRKPPPRASLVASSSIVGKFVNPGRTKDGASVTTVADGMRTRDEGGTIVRHTNDNYNSDDGMIAEDVSLWVVGYGYRNVAQFRALYHQLSSCGVITARRGGLSCFGEGRRREYDDGGAREDDRGDDDHSNWVAVRYESALHAHKALCQHGNIVNVGGGCRGAVIFGVMPLSEPGVASKLFGIQFAGASSSSRVGAGVAMVGGSSSSPSRIDGRRKLITEADVVRDYGDDETKSDLDSLCGRVLAWFFMWD